MALRARRAADVCTSAPIGLTTCSFPGRATDRSPIRIRPLEFTPAESASRFDHGFPGGMRSAWALASLGVFEAAGWSWVHERAASLAASLADRLAERGLAVGPRGRSTLVSWPAEDPEAEVARLAAAGDRRAQHPGVRPGASIGRRLVLRGRARRARRVRSRLSGSPERRDGGPASVEDPVRVRVDVDTRAARKTAQGQTAVLGDRDGQRARGADANQDRRSGHRRLLHELERQAAADTQDLSRERAPSPRAARDRSPCPSRCDDPRPRG